MQLKESVDTENEGLDMVLLDEEGWLKIKEKTTTLIGTPKSTPYW